MWHVKFEKARKVFRRWISRDRKHWDNYLAEKNTWLKKNTWLNRSPLVLTIFPSLYLIIFLSSWIDEKGMTNPRTFNFLDLGKYSTQSVFLKRSNSPLFCSGLAGGSEGQSPCPQSHTWQSIKCQTIEKLNKICSKEDCWSRVLISRLHYFLLHCCFVLNRGGAKLCKKLGLSEGNINGGGNKMIVGEI